MDLIRLFHVRSEPALGIAIAEPVDDDVTGVMRSAVRPTSFLPWVPAVDPPMRSSRFSAAVANRPAHAPWWNRRRPRVGNWSRLCGQPLGHGCDHTSTDFPLVEPAAGASPRSRRVRREIPIPVSCPSSRRSLGGTGREQLVADIASAPRPPGPALAVDRRRSRSRISSGGPPRVSLAFVAGFADSTRLSSPQDSSLPRRRPSMEPSMASSRGLSTMEPPQNLIWR